MTLPYVYVLTRIRSMSGNIIYKSLLPQKTAVMLYQHIKKSALVQLPFDLRQNEVFFILQLAT